jgi:hypothetical protein
MFFCVHTGPSIGIMNGMVHLASLDSRTFQKCHILMPLLFIRTKCGVVHSSTDLLLGTQRYGQLINFENVGWSGQVLMRPHDWQLVIIRWLGKDIADIFFSKFISGPALNIFFFANVTRRHEMSRFAHLRKVRKREK